MDSTQPDELSILPAMKACLLILISIVGLWFNWKHLKKALAQITEKNKAEPSFAKRVLSYPLTVIWYGYLFAFLIGLSVNNLIFT